jgi:hypothetical protein
MKMVKMYEANDGTVFDTEEECVSYEHQVHIADAVERTQKTVSLVGWRGGNSDNCCVLERDFPEFVAKNWQALEAIVRSARKAAS